MDTSPTLPDSLAAQPTDVVVVLFSQHDCVYCQEVRDNYLRPMSRALPDRVRVAEIETGSSRPLQDWAGRRTTHAAFARDHGIRFMPTVSFFDARGRTVAPPIVGLSRDFFGGYLDSRIAIALQAAAV